MSTRNVPGAEPTPGTTATAAPFATPGDLPRLQMAAATAALCALFRSFEAMRAVQLNAARAALGQHDAALDRLRSPCSPIDLVALQAELMRCDLQEAGAYWFRLGALALEAQREWLDAAGGPPRPATQVPVTVQADGPGDMPAALAATLAVSAGPRPRAG